MILLLTLGCSMRDSGAVGDALGVPALLVYVAGCGVAALIWYYLFVPACPACRSRGTIRWLHATKRGQPDQRHRVNRKFCMACDHTLDSYGEE